MRSPLNLVAGETDGGMTAFLDGFILPNPLLPIRAKIASSTSMNFVSYTFLFVFLPLVLGIYYIVPKRGKDLVLFAASMLFYGWWRMDFLGLMLLSTGWNYFFGLKISQELQEIKRRRWLMISVSLNLAYLAYFKYCNFGMEQLNFVLSQFGVPHVLWTRVVLPVGISFYTFQSISYLFDIYRKEAPVATDYLHFALYIILFPQLVAGPIVRYKTIAAQLIERTHSLDLFVRGILIFILGFAKKVLVADNLASLTDTVFDGLQPGFLDGWLCLYSYTMQLYFDFSGYSDMAIGLGWMFGFHFPRNFNAPYLSESITDFWRRWHMSLSESLRDYLYIPLGGNRGSMTRTYFNLLLTMLLGGVWHGANWTFVLWGGYHGLLLSLERLRGRQNLFQSGKKWINQASTFMLVMIGWLIFASPDLVRLRMIFEGLLGFHGLASSDILRMGTSYLTYAAIVLTIPLTWICPQAWELVQTKRLSIVLGIAVLFFAGLLMLIFHNYSPFLYFQF